MFALRRRRPLSPNYPVEHRNVALIGDRVTEIETRHVGEEVWVAVGHVSEPVPTGPRLQSPIEMTATGRTEQLAVDALKRRIEQLGRT